MDEYIDRKAFLADKKWLYCTDCDKRKGKKRGKMVTIYEIGEAPCKSCGIHDMLEEVEEYPAADVRPVVRGQWIIRNNRAGRYGITCSECGEDVTSVAPCIGFLPNVKVTLDYCPYCGSRNGGADDV